MKEETYIKQKLATRLQNLPSEQIKQGMLQWLGKDDSSLEKLEQEINGSQTREQAISQNPVLEKKQHTDSSFSIETVNDLIGAIDSSLEPKNTCQKTAFEEAVANQPLRDILSNQMF